ncbi:MAG: triose-phosphate isomerase [Deltaproteobacteria bacterium]|nr:triose-phosphate isomerase [Deltaproteobacteria bacterium]
MALRIPMIAGNWKMNLGIAEGAELVRGIAAGIRDVKGVDVLVAPPFTALPAVREAIGDAGIFLGAQNMHWETEGAYTGEVSAAMLKETGCTHVILGHSERRSLFRESSEDIDRKAAAAVREGLIPILCIGETLEEREQGLTFDVIRRQLEGSLQQFRVQGSMPASTILAYEPVWAIGTGLTATPDEAREVHGFIRGWLGDTFVSDAADQVRILYGGSVKPGNAADLMAQPDIDGALVGGASLQAETFAGIVRFDPV